MNKKSFLIIYSILFFFCSLCSAATIKNVGPNSQNIIVTEGGEQHNIIIEPNQSQSICPKGCFITLVNGDKFALDGSETIEVVEGTINFR